ncbi:MAG: class I SAM-dependent methyltransferase [Planctomycetes bacterium]|nr:class I SAM-dependent methyltransferase [Planctomycetota bacterium]
MPTLPADYLRLYESRYHEAYGQGASRLFSTEASRSLREFLESSDVPVSGRALDAGCGEGRNLSLLSTFGWKTLGIDNSPSALKTASKIFEKERKKIQFTVSDFLEMPDIGSEEFTIVAHVQTLHLVLRDVDRKNALAEAHRVLKPGGFLYAETAGWSADSRATERGALKHFGDHGLTRARERVLVATDGGKREIEIPSVPIRVVSENMFVSEIEQSGFTIFKVLSETIHDGLGNSGCIIVWATKES